MHWTACILLLAMSSTVAEQCSAYLRCCPARRVLPEVVKATFVWPCAICAGICAEAAYLLGVGVFTLARLLGTCLSASSVLPSGRRTRVLCAQHVITGFMGWVAYWMINPSHGDPSPSPASCMEATKPFGGIPLGLRSKTGTLGLNHVSIVLFCSFLEAWKIAVRPLLRSLVLRDSWCVNCK